MREFIQNFSGAESPSGFRLFKGDCEVRQLESVAAPGTVSACLAQLGSYVFLEEVVEERP